MGNFMIYQKVYSAHCTVSQSLFAAELRGIFFKKVHFLFGKSSTAVQINCMVIEVF